MLERGALVAGYRIEDLVGRGGMGVVYRATHDGLERTVALKVMAPEVAHDGMARARFQRESRLAASINHPNVVTVYDVGEYEGALFIAMELIVGPSLDDVLAAGAGEPAPAPRVIEPGAGGLRGG